MSTFLPINQKLELERLHKVLCTVSFRASKHVYFNISQFIILLRIYKHEPVPFSGIKTMYKIHPSKLTRSLEALGTLGFIKSVRDPVDNRKAILSMSDLGRSVVEELLQITI